MSEIAVSLDHCPNDWKRIALGDICDVIGGYPAPKGDEPFRDGTIPFVRMQDLGRYHRTTNLLETKNKLNSSYIKKNKLRIIEKGSILIPRSGSVSWNHRAILGSDACIVSHICALVLKNSKINNEYLYDALCNFDMRTIMKKTTGLDAITFDDVKRVQIPFPSLNFQKKIVSILNKVSETLTKQYKSIEYSNQLINSYFLKIFGDPILNPNSWEATTLSNALIEDPNNGIFKKKEFYGRGNPVVWVESLFDRYVLESDNFRKIKANEKEIKKFSVVENDILLCRSSLPVEGVGKMVVVAKMPKSLLFECHVMRLKVDQKKVLPSFVVGFYQSSSGRKIILKKAHIGTMTTINQQDVKKLEFLVPPMDLQQKFDNFFHVTVSIQNDLKKYKEKLKNLFNILNYKLFQGEYII